jgi:alanyl-tRNA synthetase
MDIRKEYLEFFKGRGHDIVPTMSLVPDDATLLFTNAGMVQFKDIFVGNIPTPENPKATSTQLCLRAGGKHNDLENVGYTARHHTLFEMLGNFSFGDYFKKEAIAYSWEFVTSILDLPVEKLWVTIHDSDDEAYELWREHISEDRIKRFGDKDNFWSMGDTGPCGPCSEIFYDQGSEHFSSEEDYLGGEGDRFLEIWNLVFMQYERSADGTMTPLPKPSIDTGMGLERVVSIKEGVQNNYDSSLFMPIIKRLESISNTKISDTNIASFRVIADHLRAVSFLLSEGVLFDKEGRGYVLRRILRRAVRHGYLLGFKSAFLSELVDTLCDLMGEHYVSLNEQKSHIKEQITLEENRFFKTIENGMTLFNEELEKTEDIFCGEVAFKLYDTYGFPLDLTEDMLREKGLKLDIEAYDKAMSEQRKRSQGAWKGSGADLHDGDFKAILQKHGVNEFVGYETTQTRSKIVAILDENFHEIDELQEGFTGWVMLDKTPFYATSGGQEGDLGAIGYDENISIVEETKKFHDINLSKVLMRQLSLKVGDEVESLVIDRDEVAKHHSATHLLQVALKEVLGDSVSQAGSMNSATKLRFDFTHNEALSAEQLDVIETIVNDMIAEGLENDTKVMPIEEAKKSGAIALFGEKYGDEVRVVDFEGVSVEFCGGTHVANTSDIGSFYITKESGVSSGVRRIEAVVGRAAYDYAKSFISKVTQLEYELKTKDLSAGIEKLKTQIKDLKSEIKVLSESSSTALSETKVGDTTLIVDIVPNGDIKNIIDDYKNKLDNVALFLLQPKGEKVLMACGSKGCSIKAGDWIKAIAPIVGGGGGGRPDFAQAGGKDVSKIEEAKEAALEYITK